MLAVHHPCVNLLRVIAWFAGADKAPGGIVRPMSLQIVPNQLADDLRGRHILSGAKFLEGFFLHRVYQ